MTLVVCPFNLTRRRPQDHLTEVPSILFYLSRYIKVVTVNVQVVPPDVTAIHSPHTICQVLCVSGPLTILYIYLSNLGTGH